MDNSQQRMEKAAHAHRRRIEAAQEAESVEDEARPSREAAPKRSKAYRIASLRDIPKSLEPLGAGFYKAGHTIWELRGAEDEEGGYVLTRKHEERAVDMRSHTASTQDRRQAGSASRPTRASTPKYASLRKGQKSLLIRQGQVHPVIVIEVHEDDGAAMLQDEMGGSPFVAPLDMLLPMPAPMMPEPEPATALSISVEPSPEAPMTSGCGCSKSMALPAPMPEPIAPAPLSTLPEPAGDPMLETLPMPSEVMDDTLQGAGDSQAPHTCDCTSGCPCPCHVSSADKNHEKSEGMEPKVREHEEHEAEGGMDGGFDAEAEEDDEEKEDEYGFE